MTRNDEERPGSAPINTILLYITLAVLCFIGTVSYTNSIAIARIESSIITRVEIEGKFSNLKDKASKIETDISRLKYEVESRHAEESSSNH